MTAVGEYAQHEAEMALCRAAAVRDLMATGATHGEACAAVDERLALSWRRVMVDIHVAADAVESALAQLGEALSNILGAVVDRRLRWVRPDRDWPMFCPECYEWALPEGIIERGGGVRPRTVVRCDDCLVQWRYGRRVRRRSMRNRRLAPPVTPWAGWGR